MKTQEQQINPSAEHVDRTDHMMSFMHIARRRMLDAFSQDFNLRVYEKGDGSKYTQVDLEINDLFIDYIYGEFPQDAVLGEEGVFKPPGFNPDEHWTWLIDPVDGTGGFIKNVNAGTPDNCTSSVMISAFAPGEFQPCMSVVYKPFGEPELYELNSGSVVEQKRLREVVLHSIDPWPNCQQPIKEIEKYLLSPPAKKISSVGVAAGRVATGQLDVCIFPGPDSNPHDYVPAIHIMGMNAQVWATNLEGKNRKKST